MIDRYTVVFVVGMIVGMIVGAATVLGSVPVNGRDLEAELEEAHERLVAYERGTLPRQW